MTFSTVGVKLSLVIDLGTLSALGRVEVGFIYELVLLVLKCCHRYNCRMYADSPLSGVGLILHSLTEVWQFRGLDAGASNLLFTHSQESNECRPTGL